MIYGACFPSICHLVPTLQAFRHDLSAWISCLYILPFALCHALYSVRFLLVVFPRRGSPALDSGRGWVYNKVSAEWESLCRHRNPAVFGYTLGTGFFPRRFVIGAAGEDVRLVVWRCFGTRKRLEAFLEYML